MVVHGMFVCGKEKEGEAGLGLGVNVDISAHSEIAFSFCSGECTSWMFLCAVSLLGLFLRDAIGYHLFQYTPEVRMLKLIFKQAKFIT